MRERIAAALGPIVGVALFALAVWLLERELREFHYADVMAHLAAIPRSRLLLALGLTAASYLCLTGYDVLALREAGVRLPYRRVGSPPSSPTSSATTSDCRSSAAAPCATACTRAGASRPAIWRLRQK